jgi:hypothetical protein
MKRRRVLPEILDELPAHHPDAILSRRDLRWINLFMGNHRWLCRQISTQVPVGASVLELGAGDGSLLRQALRRGIVQPRQWHALDLVPAPPEWPAEAHWWQQDVLAAPLPEVQVVIANLFLHHFEAPALAQLAAALPETVRWVFFSEPERRRLHLWQGWLLHGLIRLNRVTRHDLRVSIEAGFRGSELVQAMGLGDATAWRTQQQRTFFGAHRVSAQRVLAD